MSRTRCGETHGYHKQGVDYGYSKVKGLNALLAIVSTPVAAPVIAATRWRTGPTNSAWGAPRLVPDARVTAGRAGATGMVTVRCDSAYYNHDVVAAARRGGAHFSVTASADPAVRKAIASIGEDAWVAINYPEAIWDEDEGRWIPDAEVAEVPFTAFTSRRKAEQVTARLIVRRVRRLNPVSVPAGQSELFAAYRHHAVFTDSPLPMLAAETGHRGHAIVEQVIADLKGGPLAHMPSGRFAANSAWTVLAAIAFNPRPRRRRPGLGVPRQGDHRDDPRPPDRRPRTAVPHRPAAANAPAPRLALGDRLEPTVQQRLRPTGAPGPPDHPAAARRAELPEVEEPDRPADPACSLRGMHTPAQDQIKQQCRPADRG